MDFGYLVPIQEDRMLEWIDNQSLDCHRDEQHIFELGGSQMGNNDVPGYVELVFRFFFARMMHFFARMMPIFAQSKINKIEKIHVTSRQSIFLQPAQITSWLK